MNEGLDKSRGRRILGAGLMAGALAAGSPAHAQNAVDRGDDTDYTDSSADYSDYSFQPSVEVVSLFDSLDKEVGDTLSITPDQIAKVHAAIDDFVAKHPPVEGKTITEGNNGSSESSYSPWAELQDGIWFGTEKNPIVIGLAMAYIKEKAITPGIDAK